MENNQIMQLTENYLTEKVDKKKTEYLKELLQHISSRKLSEKQYIELFEKVNDANGVRLAILTRAPRNALIEIYKKISLDNTKTDKYWYDQNYILMKLGELRQYEADNILTDASKCNLNTVILKKAIKAASLETLLEFIKTDYLLKELEGEIVSKLKTFKSVEIANSFWDTGKDFVRICMAKYVSKDRLISLLCTKNSRRNVYLDSEAKENLRSYELTEEEAKMIMDKVTDEKIRLFASEYVSKEYILQNISKETDIQIVESFLKKLNN